MKNVRLIKILIISLCTGWLCSAFAAPQLIVEPDAGRAPLLSAIKQARSSIDLVMYGLTDNQFINALIGAQKSGKQVRILLEPSPYKAETENSYAIKRFQKAQLDLRWPSSEFKLTHQKTFVLDDKSAIIMTFNLTRSSFKNERNFALIIDDAAEVKEITSVFAADWLHQKIQVNNPHLIWSPDNSRERIMAFIASAQQSIQIYMQDLSDYQTIGILAKVARGGKKISVITSTVSDKNKNKLNYLKKAGVDVRVSTRYLIHAKAIIVDDTRAILGSTNLSYSSMNTNRELAIITTDKKIIEKLKTVFAKDWLQTRAIV